VPKSGGDNGWVSFICYEVEFSGAFGGRQVRSTLAVGNDYRIPNS